MMLKVVAGAVVCACSLYYYLNSSRSQLRLHQKLTQGEPWLCKHFLSPQFPNVLSNAEQLYSTFFEVLVDTNLASESLMRKLFPWRNESASLLLNYYKEYLKSSKLTVKLILSAGNTTPVDGLLKPYVSEAMKSKSVYGCSHAGLQLGPWYIDWDYLELAIPWPVCTKIWQRNNRVILSLDIDEIEITKEKLVRLSHLMTTFNNEVSFSLTQFNPQRYIAEGSNCACFVNAALTALGVNLSKIQQSAIGELLADVRENPSETLKMKYKDMIFVQTKESHNKLTDYYQQNKFSLSYYDYSILKAFDRRMHLNDRFNVLKESSCPFGRSRLESFNGFEIKAWEDLFDALED